MERKKTIPRGIRNNNPLNIRIGNVWLGESPNPTDPDFEQFVNMTAGVRAAFVLLRRYINHYHRNTIPQIISAWAPASENNTQRYIDFVCSSMGINPDERIIFEDKETMIQLVDAMIRFENGQSVKFDVIQRGYELS